MTIASGLHQAKPFDPSNDFLVRVSRLLFVIGLFFTSLLVLRIGGALTIGDLFLAASLITFLFAAKRPPVYGGGLGMSFAALILILVGGALATGNAIDETDSAITLARVVFVALIIPWQARALLDTPKRMARGVMSFGLGAAVCGLGTLAQSMLGPNIIPGSTVTSAGRFPGFTSHVSDAGGISCLAVVIGFAALGRVGNKLVSLFILASGIVGLVLSGSVSGMLAAAVGVVVVLLSRGVSFKRMVLIGAAAGAGLWVADMVLASVEVALDPMERINQVFGLSGQSVAQNTSASRLETDILGWEGFAQNPFVGAGLDTQSSIVLGTLPVHNFFLAALYQGGLFLGLGLLLIVIRFFVRALRNRTGPFAGVAFAMGVTTVVFAMTAPSFFNRYFWIPMAFLGVQAAISSRGLFEAEELTTEKTKKDSLPSPAYAHLVKRS